MKNNDHQISTVTLFLLALSPFACVTMFKLMVFFRFVNLNFLKNMLSYLIFVLFPWKFSTICLNKEVKINQIFLKSFVFYCFSLWNIQIQWPTAKTLLLFVRNIEYFTLIYNAKCLKPFSWHWRFLINLTREKFRYLHVSQVGEDRDHSPEGRHVVTRPSADGLYPSRHS